MSTPATSSTPGNGPLRRGILIAGFELVRPLGQGSCGTVYEATQVSLGRTVALRLLDGTALGDAGAELLRSQQASLATIHHPAIVPTYEIGEWPGGWFVATRFVRGASLERAMADGSVRREQLPALLEFVGEALEAAHTGGVVHGNIVSRNILIDQSGQALLADLGLARDGDAAADRRALAALADEVANAPAPRPSWPRLAAGGALVAILVVGLIALIAGGGDEAPPASDQPAPPVVAGTTAFGSDLAPGPSKSLGCAPEPTPNTPSCTLLQTRLDGRALVMRDRGLIQAWAVRGAVGELTLEVIRGPDDEPFVRGFSVTEQLSGGEPDDFAANIPVRPGDRIGLLLGPGSTIGSRVGSAEEASIVSWGGALSSRPRIPRTPTRLEGELLLRVDVAVGARPAPGEEFRGDEAAAAAAGERLDSLTVDLSGGSAEVAIVELDSEIFIDVFDGASRRARIAVPDADPAGELVNFESICGPNRGFCLLWRNEDGSSTTHEYKLNRDGTRVRLIS